MTRRDRSDDGRSLRRYAMIVAMAAAGAVSTAAVADECTGGPADDVIKACTALLKRHPKETRAYVHLSYAHRQDHTKKGYNLALKDLNTALAIEPASSLLFGERGDLYRSMGYNHEADDATKKELYAHAMSDFDRAVELDPGNADALGGRAELHGLLRDYAHEIADRENVLRLNPKDARNKAMLESLRKAIAEGTITLKP